MYTKRSSAIIVFIMIFTLCVSENSLAISKKRKKEREKLASIEAAYNQLQIQCRDSAIYYNDKINTLTALLVDQQEQIKAQKESNDKILNHLKDLSLVSNTQAESINRFLVSLGDKDAYIRQLQDAIARKDSITLALAMNLKSAVGDVNDKDIEIKVEKGVIYVDISDKMLFQSGKYEVTGNAKKILGKVAKVLLAHPDVEFMVEGHTDNKPYSNGLLADNWDLSVKRATSVVRILQKTYGLSPAQMTAAGRGEYMPATTNDTPEGRAINRRTRIIILPQFDQFFNLLEKAK